MHLKNFLVNYEEILQKISSNKIILGIITISLLVFSHVFTGSEFLTYDDNWYIYENQNVIDISWESIKNIFTKLQGGQYSPLGELYHSILYALFGENATAFKICALFVHLLNTYLLFNIFIRIFESKLFVSIIVLFFAIHPMQVETIGWLSVIFRNAVTLMFLGYFFYIKYLESNYQKSRLIPVLIFYILAFLTKEQAILFPVGLFLIHIIKSDKIYTKWFIIEMVCWTLVALVFGLITIEVTKTGGPNIIDRNVSFYGKILLLAKTIIDYCYNFLFPYQLSFSYPYPNNKFNISVFNIVLAALLLFLGSFIAFRNKVFRFGFLWALGFLSLGLAFAFFHLRDSYMADRYVYLAIIGFSILLYKTLIFLKEKGLHKTGFLAILLLFIISFSVISFDRVKAFKNNKNVWAQALEVNPKNAFAYNSLGYYYRNASNLDSAYVLYKKALKLQPDHYLAHTNITKVLYDKKQYDSALYHISEAIKLQPTYARAYENRAVLYSILDKRELYLQDLNTLIKLSPDNAKFRINRAKFYFKQKRYNESLQDALELIKKPSNHNEAIFSLAGNNLLILNKFRESEIMLSKAIELNPKEGKNFYLRSVAKVKSNKWGLGLKDALQAKKLGYKVNQGYLAMLAREVKKRNN